MTAKRVKGVVKDYHISGSDRLGYRPVWDMGRAAGNKKRTRMSGINRPST